MNTYIHARISPVSRARNLPRFMSSLPTFVASVLPIYTHQPSDDTCPSLYNTSASRVPRSSIRATLNVVTLDRENESLQLKLVDLNDLLSRNERNPVAAAARISQEGDGPQGPR